MTAEIIELPWHRPSIVAGAAEIIASWPHGVPDGDLHIVNRAERCEEKRMPFQHDGRRWVVTYVGGSHGEEDDFVIEGVPWN